MAFGVITTLFFPVTANAGASMWGTDVRKLITPADAGNDAATKFAMSTNAAAHTVTADPYTSQTLDLAEADYGWAIQPSDMNSVAGALRAMGAGNHVALLRIQSTTATNPNGSLTMFAYRVGPAAGRARTLLGSATITGQTFDTTIRTYTITLALGALVFAADETIQYSFELNGQGVAITGKNNSFYTGTITAIPAKIDFPALVTQHTLSSDIVGDGVLTRQLDGATSQNLVGDGVVTRQFSGAMTRDLTGDGTVTRSLDVTVNRDVVGDGTISREGLPVDVFRDLTGDGVLDVAKAVTAAKTFDLIGDGEVSESHVGDLFRSFDLTGDGVISGSADIPFPDIPACAPDWTPNDGLKAIAGTVLFHEPPNQGDPVSSATVCLFRDSDGVRIECTTTAPDGSYSFPRDTNDPYTYHVEVNYENAGVKQQGLSEGGCVPL